MRRAALWAGFLLLAAIWLGPLLDAWNESFAAHMLAHMGVIALVAPLLAIGIPLRWRPGPATPVVVPILASVLELFAVWAWHAPAMRRAVQTSAVMTIAEQGTFLFVGVFLWATSLAAPSSRSHAAAGATALLLTSIHMTLLGALLALSPRPLYGTGEVSCFGIVLNAGQDQHLGGVLMLIVGAVAYLTGAIHLMLRLLDEHGRSTEYRAG